MQFSRSTSNRDYKAIFKTFSPSVIHTILLNDDKNLFVERNKIIAKGTRKM